MDHSYASRDEPPTKSKKKGGKKAGPKKARPTSWGVKGHTRHRRKNIGGGRRSAMSRMSNKRR